MEEEANLRFWTLVLHSLLVRDRGITHQALALELGCSLTTVKHYLNTGGRAPLRERVDSAITAIWERQSGRQYPRALRTAGPLLEDGLPLVIQLLDPGFPAYLQEEATKSLMDPGVPYRSTVSKHLKDEDPSFENAVVINEGEN